jgi:hypothetical protein
MPHEQALNDAQVAEPAPAADGGIAAAGSEGAL